jgi:hypothetical protein
MKNISKQELIDEILDQFDFDKVKQVMDALQWEWSMESGSHVPDIPEMRKLARRLLKQVAGKSPYDYYAATGGFCVEKDADGFLELRFEVTSWNTWDSFDPNTVEIEE